MANCVCNILRALWSCILGSLRIILFLLCLIYLFLSVISLIVLVHSASSFSPLVPGGSLGLGVYLQGVALIILSLLGCYGSFFKHHGSLKVFALLTALNTALLILMVMYTMGPDQRKEFNDELVARMNQLAPKYDWGVGDKSSFEATEAWDMLQTLQCCGINGPRDWDRYRPSDVEDNTLPPSCCLNTRHQVFHSPRSEKDLCNSHSNSVFGTGCLERVEEIEQIGLWTHFVLIGFQIILCGLAFIVGNLNLDLCSNGRSGQRAPGASVPMGSRQAVDSGDGFQRFTGSLYVRQPPVNEAYEQKRNPAPMYPDAREVERNPYLVPPPSYGSVS